MITIKRDEHDRDQFLVYGAFRGKDRLLCMIHFDDLEMMFGDAAAKRLQQERAGFFGTDAWITITFGDSEQ